MEKFIITYGYKSNLIGQYGEIYAGIFSRDINDINNALLMAKNSNKYYFFVLPDNKEPLTITKWLIRGILNER